VFRKRYGGIYQNSKYAVDEANILTCSGNSRKKTTGGPVLSNIAVIGGMRVLRNIAKAPGSRAASALSLNSDATFVTDLALDYAAEVV
jgi:hypothetical protein